MMNIALLLELAAESLGDRVALNDRYGTLSYAGLYAMSREMAVRIQGYESGNLAYLGKNNRAFPAALFAAGMVEIPFSPLNYRLTDERLNRLVRRLSPVTVVCDDEMVARIEPAEGVVALSQDALLETRPGGGELAPVPEPSETAVLLFTSGTSGEPKAAILKHENLSTYVVESVEFLSANEDESILTCMPPYHISGVTTVLSSVYAGRRLVQIDQFSPQAWIDAVAAHDVTHTMVVPTMLSRILDSLEQEPRALPSLRAIAYGGGRMPEGVIRKAMTEFPGVDFVNAYGLTETSSTVSVLGPEEHRRAFTSEDSDVGARLASVGKPLPGVAVEIRNEAGEPVEAGQSGEIWLRGDQVSGEYVEKSAKAADGWFPTQDLGFFDEEGFLFIKGRLDDVIVRGGENISPGEVEDCLRTCFGVLDAAVIGAPDEEWGEKVVAFVVVDPGQEVEADTLKDWVASRLRSTRAPETVYFRTALPYNDTGKLLRRLLREELSQENIGV